MDLPKLRDFLDAFDVHWTIAGGVAVGSGTLLYLHDQDIKYLRGLPEWADTLLFVLVVYGCVVVGMKSLSGLADMNSRRRSENRRFANIHTALNSLSPEERGVFKHLLENGQQSFTTSVVDAAVATLIQKGLIARGQGAHSALDWPHTVPNDVWMVLQIRQHEFLELN